MENKIENKTLRVFILEDEKNTFEYLTLLVKNELNNVSVVGGSGSIKEARELFKEIEFDILITDIRLEDGLVFELLKTIDKINFPIIFMSTFQDYGFQAIQFSAVDYLLKPFDAQSLKNAFHTAVKRLLLLSELEKKYELLLSNYFNHNDISILVNKYTNESININDILYVEASSNYAIIHCKKKSYTVSKTLKDVEEMIRFKSPLMLRIHKSYLVNMQHIVIRKKFPSSSRFIQLSNGHELEISKRKWNEIKRILQE